MKIDKHNAPQYIWGNGCDGWPLVDREGLSVKQERMPAGTAEARHYHQKAVQFFFVLQGMITIEIEGETYSLEALQGLEVAPGLAHQVLNRSAEAAEFMVVSQPNTSGDRFDAPAGEPGGA